LTDQAVDIDYSAVERNEMRKSVAGFSNRKTID